MASASTGKAQDLSQGRAEALQALFNALPSYNVENQGGKISASQLQALSDRLGEMIPEGGASFQNGRMELLNEEGLPIIDITEPESNGVQPQIVDDTIPEEPELIPLQDLPARERERRRMERERILDALEAEENAAAAHDAAAERASFETHKDASGPDIATIKSAREMQKKLGKALLRDMAAARAKEEAASAEQRARDEEAAAARRPKGPRKTVSFADLPAGAGEPRECAARKLDVAEAKQFSEITRARLRPPGTSMPTTKAQVESRPMKMNVVERGVEPVNGSVSAETRVQPDSDDESSLGSPIPSDEEDSFPSADLEDEQPSLVLPRSDSSDQDDEDEAELEFNEDQVDLDAVQHQREIALAYYEKRDAIGAEAAQAITAHVHDDSEDEWNQPEVPVEATLAGIRPKPAVSRFKAARLSSSAPTSPTVSASVIPPGAVQQAIRIGKLESGQLIGHDDDGDSAEDPQLLELLAALDRGDVENVGPKGALTSAVSSSNGTVVSTPASVLAPAPQPGPSTTAQQRVSRFKSERRREVTPETSVLRSSPKLSPPLPASPRAKAVAPPNAAFPPMIVDSPSFPESQAKGKDGPPAVMSASVRESCALPQARRDPALNGDGEPRKASRFKAGRM